MIDYCAIIRPQTTLLKAMEIMDKEERKLLIICEENIFRGVISIGDIQRSILNKVDLSMPVNEICRTDIVYANKDDKKEKIKKLMTEERIECMPVVDNGILVDMIEWKELFNEKQRFSVFTNPPAIVIMAGGRGNRLKPLTNVVPKPLIPLSEKTIIEEIMEQFFAVGCREFYISINYKAQMIIDYLRIHHNKEQNLHYLKEDRPMGTIGALQYLADALEDTFFVTNCDILLDTDLRDLYQYHKDNNNIITVVSVVKKYPIPYGIIETEKNGLLINLIEKPEYIYQINSGVYVMEPKIFSFIKTGECLDITDLIRLMLEKKERVGVFPVSEGSWRDMGNWNDYLDIINRKE